MKGNECALLSSAWEGRPSQYVEAQSQGFFNSTCWNADDSSGSSVSRFSYCLHRSTTLAEGKAADTGVLSQSFGLVDSEPDLDPKALVNGWWFSRTFLCSEFTQGTLKVSTESEASQHCSPDEMPAISTLHLRRVLATEWFNAIS